MATAKRRKLLSALRKINKNVLVKLTAAEKKAGVRAGHFSDWHDRWRDNDGGWSDGFGKAGG